MCRQQCTHATGPSLPYSAFHAGRQMQGFHLAVYGQSDVMRLMGRVGMLSCQPSTDGNLCNRISSLYFVVYKTYSLLSKIQSSFLLQVTNEAGIVKEKQVSRGGNY